MFEQPLAPGALFRPFQAGGSMLFLYSPKNFGAQVIRPYIYNFTDNMIDRLTSSVSMTEAVTRSDNLKSPDIACAIRPEANGILLDTGVVSNSWTFLLILDLAPKYLGGDIAAIASPSRMICSGWCVDTPVVEYTINSTDPVMNPNCILHITHHCFINFMDRANSIGAMPQTNVRVNNDLIDSSLDMMAANVDTYLMTPGDVIRNVHMDNGIGTRVTTEGTAAVANVNTGAACIQSVLKSPMHHLKEIVMNLGSAIDLENSADKATRSAMDNAIGVSDTLENVTRTFSNNVPHSTGQPWQQMAIDVTVPITIQELDQRFPGIQVVIQKIARESQWDVIPQTEISAKVTYSSMVSAAITSIAMECGLAHIDFSYSSFVPKLDLTASDKGVWQFRPPADILIPNPDPGIAQQQLEAAVMKFRYNLENNLFPVLKAASGDFQLHARYDANSETIVDLHFEDFSYSTEGRGFYESSNRMSQLNNPMIGTDQQFISNGAELNKLIAGCTGKSVVNALGTPTFPPNMPGAMPSGMMGGSMPNAAAALSGIDFTF